MRYWIYWNDLVQGPFEADELRTLRAFTADLPVCEEDRQDWTPAAALSELLPYFQPLVEAYTAPSSAPPPPPPPPQPPMLSPLQGEFFSESSQQQSLFDLNGSKQFMFRPAQDDVGMPPEVTLTPFTSPFRFFSTNLAPWDLAPAPVPQPIFLPPVPLPAIEPEILNEAELGILEPEDMIFLESLTRPPPKIEAPPPVKVVPLAPLPPPVSERIPLPPVIKETPVKAVPVLRPLPITRPVTSIPDFIPSGRRIEDESEISETARLWPWIAGVCLFIGVSISGVYLRSVHRSHTPPKPNDAAPATPPQTNSSESGVPSSVQPVPNSEIKPTGSNLNTQTPETPPVPAPAPVSTHGRSSTWQTLSLSGSKSARMITPAAVMVDSQGQVWITDPLTHRLQAAQISDADGMVQTAGWDVKGKAGNAPGQFHAPIGMASDAQGHVWVADTGNNRIQMYDPSTKTWVALGQTGNAAGQFNAPSSVALDPQGRIWVADKANHRIQSYDPATQQWTSIGQLGTALGQFNYPTGVAVDAHGLVWIADQDNHRLQSYNPVTSEWKAYGQKGKSLGSFNLPNTVAVDSHGRVWVTEQGNDRVQVYNPRTDRWAAIGKQGRKIGEFNLPSGVAFDPQGRAWIADRGNHRLQVAQGVTVVPLASGKHVKSPAAPSNQAGAIWQTLSASDSKDGKTITPAAVMFDPQGQVWIADPVTQQLQAAQISQVAGALQVAGWDVKGQAGNAPGQFQAPTGAVSDSQGHVWIADKGNNRIQMYDPGTAKWVTLGQAGNAAGQFNAPSSVAVDPQGHVWVADQSNHRVQSYDPVTQQWTTIGQPGSAAGQLNNPAGIAVDAQGVVWIADQGNHRVQAYNPATAEWTAYGRKGSALGSFDSPSAVAVDPQGRVWVADQGNARVQVYNPRTQRWTAIGKAGRKTGEFNSPDGIAFDPQGRVWIADRDNHRLQVAQALAAAPLAAGKHVIPVVQAVVSAASAEPKTISTPSPATPTLVTPSPVRSIGEGGGEGGVPAAPVPSTEGAPSAASSASSADKWRGREQDAINAVLKQKIYDGKRTVGENAVMMLDNMHEKELLHAGETGERLYLPDKLSWSALHEAGPRYRVYLNFLAWQANGERVLGRSDQFAVEMERKSVTPLDDATHHDFYDSAVMLVHKPDPKAADIQLVLDGVDAVNRHKLRAVIMKADKQKDEQKKIQAALLASQDKLERQVVYFRTKYAEKTLQNIAKAFDFTALMKGK